MAGNGAPSTVMPTSSALNVSRSDEPRKRSGKASRGGFPVGRISMTRHGYGFVDSPEGDFFIPARDVAGAMHGDTVAIRPDTHRGKAGRSGVVVRVIDRANTTVVGRFDRHGAPR